MAQRQCGGRHDVGPWGGFALPGQDVEHDIGGMDAVTERFGTGGFDRRQTIGQHGVEDVDHLPIAIVGAGELAPDPLDRCRQHPVLEGGSIAQGAGFARWRITAIMAKANITRETWRCHPCQDLLMLRSLSNG
jgi:hypothetical protein